MRRGYRSQSERAFPPFARSRHARGLRPRECIMNIQAAINANPSTGPAAPLAGRVAIVTGSTSGIGLGIARALTLAGADIVINGLGDADQIEVTRADLAAASGAQIVYDGSDLMAAAGARGMVENAIARFGRVDILVNNAGIQHVSPIETFPDDRWDAIIALNLSAAF